MAKLSADTGTGGLITLMTDGVFMDVAPNGLSKFVIVSLVIGQDEPQLGGPAYEYAVYLVKAVSKGSSGLDVKAAAARIQTLLDYTALTVTGYTHMLSRRIERVRFTEVDSIDKDIRWQHRGGRYEFYVSPT